MRTYLKALAVLAVGLPLAASAQISNSKHDLSAGNAGASVHAASATGGGGQLCIFCHTPHHALKQELIWNHVAGNATDTFTAYTTSAGTFINSPSIQGPSLACLSCHDGTQAIGAVNNSGGGSTTAIAMASSTELVGAGALATTSYANVTGTKTGVGAMDNNHPVSIPYAGMTYNGITSKALATAAIGYYNSVVSSGCNSASGICTNAATYGTNINLYGTATAAGVECGSCHEVHNKYASITGVTYFLRAPATGSTICLACHNK